MRPIVDRQTPVKTLPSLAVGKNSIVSHLSAYHVTNLIGMPQVVTPQIPLVLRRKVKAIL